MDRRSFLLTSSLVSGGLISGLNPLEAQAASSRKLTILHTNDTHSQIEPLPNDGRKYGGMGGMARRATLVNQIRSQEKNVLLLDAGDMFQGTPYFNYYAGEPEFKLMTALKYDAATLGNHDFDNGTQGLARMLPFAGFPILNANYDFSNSALKGKFEPYHIFEKGEFKIGVFGLGIKLAGLVPDKLFTGVKYSDPVAVANEMVSQLKQAGCHLIVCLSHLGFEAANNSISDILLATQVTGINLIIGGHTHTFLDAPKTIINPQSGHETLVNQVGWAGINLGRIDFTFSGKENVKHSKSEVYTLN